MFEKKSRVGYIYDELTERMYFDGIELMPLENFDKKIKVPEIDTKTKGILKNIIFNGVYIEDVTIVNSNNLISDFRESHVEDPNKTIIRLPWTDLKGPYAEKGKLSHLNSPNVEYIYEQRKHDQDINLEADKLEAKQDLLAKIGVASSQVSIVKDVYVEYEEDFVIGSNQYFEEEKLSLVYYLNNLIENLVIYQLLVNIFNFLHYISDKEEE